jgi:hypothetical protein
MSRSKLDGADGPGKSGPHRAYYGPVAWIVILLGCWFVIIEWQMLPALINITRAALP